MVCIIFVFCHHYRCLYEVNSVSIFIITRVIAVYFTLKDLGLRFLYRHSNIPVLSAPSATARTAPLASSSGSSCTTASPPGRPTSQPSRAACKPCHPRHNSTVTRLPDLSLLFCSLNPGTEIIRFYIQPIKITANISWFLSSFVTLPKICGNVSRLMRQRLVYRS